MSVLIILTSFVLQFVLPYLLIRDPFTSWKEEMLLYLCVTWPAILRLWSHGVSHLVSYPRGEYRVTKLSWNCLGSVSLILITVVKRTVLVVVSLPKFTVKPPEKVTTLIGETFTLNCTATGDPQPVVNWKKQGAQLPVGRSQEINGVLFIRNTKKEDAGNYICAARSAGFFTAETVTSVELLLPKGKQRFFLLLEVNIYFFQITQVCVRSYFSF